MGRPDALRRRIDELAADRTSGATGVLQEVLAILAEACAIPVPIVPVARALVDAQPSMAPVWNAALAAIASDVEPRRLTQFSDRVARAPDAVARWAVDALAAGDGAGPLRVVTLSSSRSVEIALDAVRRVRPIRVACSESRPALEGRGLASRLAGAGVPVTLFADAAIGAALAAADAVLLGADAVGPEWFLNKSGSRMLAAAAAQQGVPVYLVVTRDKFVGHAVGARLVIGEGGADEVWASPPPGVEVRNPYFESTPLDVVTSLISDLGVLGIGMVPDVCDAAQDAVTLRALQELCGAG